MIKEENAPDKTKRKKQSDKVKSKTRPQSKDKAKTSKTTTQENKNKKSSDVNVKIEGDKAGAKEGESLLDLLELEMRARAIRALIRKEEDIIPNKNSGGANSTKNDSNAAVNANASTSKYVVKEMQQISVTLKQGSGLDDDVMLVIQPAPTIELLSSESENEKDEEEKNERVNKKLENKREAEKEDKNEEKSKDEENVKGEQSKRINKRLENERGTETTHSTSTIGDEPIEILDEDLKTEEHSSNNIEKHETGTEKVEKSSENKIHRVEKSSECQKFDQVTKNDHTDKDEVQDKFSKCVNSSNEVERSEISKTKDATVKSLLIKAEASIEEREQKKFDETEKTKLTIGRLEPNLETSEKEKSPEKELEDGELASDNNSKEEAELVERNNKKRSSKKSRRRHRRTKVSDSSHDESEDLDQSEVTESETGTKLRKKIKDNTNAPKLVESSDNKEEVQSEAKETKDNIRNSVEKRKHEDDKVDMEEIIDLDDYPDDMDDLENNQQLISKNKMDSCTIKLEISTNSKNTTKLKNPLDLNEGGEVSESGAVKGEPETWASRYYNTDDVQNVIKESKIQSEIRKRLRERQRLSKLNNSPNMNKTGSNSPTDIKADEEKQKPLGSVEEYLALKAAAADSNQNSPSEKSGKSHRKLDSSHKIKTHSSKRRSKSDKKYSKDDENDTTVKTKGIPLKSSVE